MKGYRPNTMDPKPQEEKVLKNTELEYESEVSNPAPPPEIPDDYEPTNDEERQAMEAIAHNSSKQGILERYQEDMEELKKLQSDLEKTVAQAEAIKQMFSSMLKDLN